MFIGTCLDKGPDGVGDLLRAECVHDVGLEGALCECVHELVVHDPHLGKCPGDVGNRLGQWQ